MAVVLTEDVPDNCPGRTLTGACFGWSTYTVMSLAKGTYFLTPKGGSSWESTESSSSTTTGSRYVHLFWPAVVPYSRSLWSASRAATDIIQMARKRTKLSQNRKLLKADPISCACGLAQYCLRS